MNEFVSITIKAVGSILLLALPLHMVITSAASPHSLLRLVDGIKAHPVRSYTYIALCIVGFGSITYMGVQELFGWMPDSWGSSDEYGEWQSTASYIAGIIALVAAFGLPLVLVGGAAARLGLPRPPPP